MWPENTRKSQPPADQKQKLSEQMPNCDPSIYVHHVALLSSGGDHISRVCFHPFEHLSPQKYIWLLSRRFLLPPGCSCEGLLLLWSIPRVPLWVVQQASQADRLSQTCFSLTFVSLCWPEGMLPSWTKFASLLFISAVAGCSCFGATHYWIVFAMWMWIWMCALGESARMFTTS